MTSTMRSRTAALALTLSLSFAAAAAAQERPSEFDGWTFSGLTFTPGISFSTLRDSNVALAGRPADGPTAADTLLMLAPFGQLDLNTPRTSATAGYRGYLRRHVDVDALDGYDQRVFASIRHRLTPRVTLFGQNEFAEMPSTDLTELNGLPFARIGSRSNRASAGVEARLSQYTDLRVRYDTTWTSFDRFDDIVNNGTIHGVSADVRRGLSPRLGVGAEGRIRRSALSSIDERTIWFQDVGGFVDYRLREFTSVTVAGGLSRLQDSRFDGTRSDPYFRVELQHQEERASMGVAFERSYTPSFGLSGSNNNRELRGFVRMPFSRNRFYVQGTGSWRRSEPFFSDELLLDTFLTNATVGYSALRWFRVEASHSYSRQDSAITGGEVSRHRIGAQLVISQPMRIR